MVIFWGKILQGTVFFLSYIFQGLRSNAFDEIGYMSNKFNYMDNLTLIHCFRNMTFRDSFFKNKQFEAEKQ